STKFNYIKLIDLAIDGITAFTTKPLRYSFIFGTFIATISFIYGLYLIGRTIFTGVDLPGYASTIITILFLGGVQLVAIGIIGEYIAKIFEETKNRPIYLIESKDMV
ncbi:MAG: glycosyltransferase, partial [Bifidobacteriaceae bacterium]|nr:glycosyltransferase [Bifidobacteriaceae bacterium]